MKHARSDYDARIQDSAGIIPDDEPVLLIRGQDAAALAALDAWVEAAAEIGTDLAVLGAVERHRERLVRWQEEHGSKVPDAPAFALR